MKKSRRVAGNYSGSAATLAHLRCADASSKVAGGMQKSLHDWKEVLLLRLRFARGGALLLLAAAANQVLAQGYPDRALRLVVPFAPGGGVDFTGRLMARKLSDSMGQSVVVDNRGGAGGVLGSEIVARAAPDGYTLTVTNNSSHGANQALNPKLPYDTIRDFTPISTIATAPHVLLAASTVAASSLKELIALARAKPGSLNYGSAGVGSQSHLSGELFKYVTRTNIVHIPYKGSGIVFAAALSGEIQLVFASSPGAMPHVKSQRLKALGVSGLKRSRIFTEIPTLSEQGLPGFDSSPWFALLGPKGLPKPIVTRLNQEIVKAVAETDVQRSLFAAGAEPVGSTPEQCAATVRHELALWTKLVKDAGIKVD